MKKLITNLTLLPFIFALLQINTCFSQNEWSNFDGNYQDYQLLGGSQPKTLNNINFIVIHGKSSTDYPDPKSRLADVISLCAKLDQYPNLKALAVKYNSLIDAFNNVPEFDKLLKKLTHIEVYSVNTEEIEILNKYPNIKHLRINRFSDKNVNYSSLSNELSQFESIEWKISSDYVSSAKEHVNLLLKEVLSLNKLKSLVIDCVTNYGSSYDLLTLNFNNLTSLKSLKVLICSKVNLEFISKLSDLEYLSIRNCSNQEGEPFPAKLFALTKLKYLSIEGFSFSGSLNFILKMKSIVNLHLDGNKFTSLPTDMSSLIHLEYLNLYGNNIAVIPMSINKLSKLKYLDLTDNNISQLPDGFGNFGGQRFKKISLSGNPIESLPESFSNINTDKLYLPKSLKKLMKSFMRNLIEKGNIKYVSWY